VAVCTTKEFFYVIGLEVPKLAEASFCVSTHVLVLREIHFAGFSTTHWLSTAAAIAVPLNVATITTRFTPIAVNTAIRLLMMDSKSVRNI
jgi:hypothetical protein